MLILSRCSADDPCKSRSKARLTGRANAGCSTGIVQMQLLSNLKQCIIDTRVSTKLISLFWWLFAQLKIIIALFCLLKKRSAPRNALLLAITELQSATEDRRNQIKYMLSSMTAGASEGKFVRS